MHFELQEQDGIMHSQTVILVETFCVFVGKVYGHILVYNHCMDVRVCSYILPTKAQILSLTLTV